MNLQPDDFLIVIGASAGGMSAIGKLLSRFTPDIPAAIVIVIHLPPEENADIFVARLQSQTTLSCQTATHNLRLHRGKAYFAPAGRHTIIKEDHIVLTMGPAEGRWRPSIDTTMRSAAASWNSHAIGIILTGMLDDGMVGMEAIQRCGGVTLVQDPNEAEYPNMPLAVIKNQTSSWCGPLNQIPHTLQTYLQQNPQRTEVPEDIRIESSILEHTNTEIDNLPKLGEHSLFSCPDCGGGLWEIKNGHAARYRCHIGHSYTETDLLQRQGQDVEKSLWVALRTMEEKRKLLVKIADKEEEQGLHALSRDHKSRAKELQQSIEHLKTLIFHPVPPTVVHERT